MQKPYETDPENTAAENRTETAEQEVRFRDILRILRKNQVMRGMTPAKLVNVLTELGPTYIKLGQILSLHSDILPQEYCDALKKLDTDADPIPFTEVREQIREAYGGENPEDLFARIEETPLGSASIAQVHRAVRKTGEQVVIKVQRRNIGERMEADIRLIRKALRHLPPVDGLKSLVNFSDVLDEMWAAAQQELDFLQEAANMEELARNNRDVVFVKVPKVYRNLLTRQVIVMEYIGGYAIGDVKGLKEAGYDLNEIGRKYADNFIRQVIQDGFFHADPHIGNVKIEGGKIVWLDLGMMGRLSEQDRRTCLEAVLAIADHDTDRLMNAVLSIVDTTGHPDRDLLYRELDDLIRSYGNTDMRRFRVGDFLRDVLDIMRNNHLKFPQGVSMLVRGLIQVEGVLSVVSPEISMMEIAMQRAEQYYRETFRLDEKLQESGKALLRGLKKSADIPQLTSEAIREYLRGRSRADVSIRAEAGFQSLLTRLAGRVSSALWGMGLLIGAGILAGSGGGWQTVLSVLCFAAAAVLGAVSIFHAWRTR